MTISRDPDHSHGASLVLREGAEEPAEAPVAGKAPGGQTSRTQTGFAARLVMLLRGAAGFGTGLIFFSFQRGLLALENIGAGIGLSVAWLLLVCGVRCLRGAS